MFEFEHISHKFIVANSLDMQKRRLLHSLVLFHNIITKNRTVYLKSEIKYRKAVHSSDLTKMFRYPCIELTFTSSFIYNLYRLYNRVPLEVKSLKHALFKLKETDVAVWFDLTCLKYRK